MTDKTDSKEREAFEAWIAASGREHMLKRDPDNGWYEDLEITARWAAWQARASLAASAGSEPVAHLWQHGETGRTRVLMPDMIVDADASWRLVGPLFLGSPPSPPEGIVGGWISVDERLPEHGQAVAFVVRTDGFQQHLNGRVLGGCFVRGQGFSVPGLGLEASHWMPLPPPPTTSAGSGKGE